MSEPAEKGVATRPLEGLRILSVEHMVSMPYATQLFAQLGADVIKVEQPNVGDSGRAAIPAVTDEAGRSVGGTFIRNSLGKRSLTLDLKSSEGKRLFRLLAGKVDVVAENMRAGKMESLRLGYEDLSAMNPGLIYVSLSGFGNRANSPYQNWAAYAPVAEAMSGLYEWRRPLEQRPRAMPAAALGDIGTGLFAAIGMLIALQHRHRSGQGQHVDVAMLDSMMAFADMVPFFHSLGVSDKGPMAFGLLETFRAKDGYFVLAVIRAPQFDALARLLGREEWLEDERFASRTGWEEHLDGVIRPAVEQWAASRSKRQAALELADAGLAAGPCFDADDLSSDEHVAKRNMLLKVRRPDATDPMLVVGNPLKLSAVEDLVDWDWPRLGQHTDEVLGELLDLDETELERLREDAVI